MLQKFKGSNCLKQLTMHDQPNPRDTCLYRISKMEGLQHFQKIYLFSSRQDNYAPYESARIEIHPEFTKAKDPLYYYPDSARRCIARWWRTFCGGWGKSPCID